MPKERVKEQRDDINPITDVIGTALAYVVVRYRPDLAEKIVSKIDRLLGILLSAGTGPNIPLDENERTRR